MLSAAAMSSTKMAAEIGAAFFMRRSWHHAGKPATTTPPISRHG